MPHAGFSYRGTGTPETRGNHTTERANWFFRKLRPNNSFWGQVPLRGWSDGADSFYVPRYCWGHFESEGVGVPVFNILKTGNRIPPIPELLQWGGDGAGINFQSSVTAIQWALFSQRPCGGHTQWGKNPGNQASEALPTGTVGMCLQLRSPRGFVSTFGAEHSPHAGKRKPTD